MKKLRFPYAKTDIILSQYFIKDRYILPDGRVRISLLLAVKRDMAFLRGLDIEEPHLALTKQQQDIFLSRTPTLTIILTYCSAIDSVARAMKAGVPKNGKNAAVFKWAAKKWFGISSSGANALWKLRNSTSHQYSISPKFMVVPHGFNSVMKYTPRGSWEFNLNGMYTSLLKAIRLTHAEITIKSLKVRHKHAKFIYQNGFMYTRY
jgi:hypothetical protein